MGGPTGEATVRVNNDATAEPREDFSVSVEVDSGSPSIVTVGSPSKPGFRYPVELDFIRSSVMPATSTNAVAVKCPVKRCC